MRVTSTRYFQVWGKSCWIWAEGRIMKWREGCRKREPVKQTSFTTAAKTNRGGPAPRVIYLSLNVNLNAHLAALFYPAPRLLLICFFLFLHCDSPEIIFTWMSRKGSTRALLLLQPACLRQLLTWVRDGGDRWRDKRNPFITQQTAEQMFAFCLSFWTFSRSWAKTLCSMFTFAWVNFGDLVSSNPLWPLFTYPFAQTFNGVSIKCEQIFSKSWFLWFDKKDTWQEWGRTELALSWVESARVALFLCLQVGEHPPIFPYCFRLGFFFFSVSIASMNPGM